MTPSNHYKMREQGIGTPFNPVCLRVISHIVHKETSTYHNSDFEKICQAPRGGQSRGTDKTTTLSIPTEQEVQRFLIPPRKQDNKRHPEQRELDQNIDRAALRKHLWRLRLHERHLLHEVDHSDQSLGSKRHDGQ
jgi:hypothetical protein